MQFARFASFWANSHIPDSKTTPLDFLPEKMKPKTESVATPDSRDDGSFRMGQWRAYKKYVESQQR